MNRVKELIPNGLTSGNLFSGCIGIVFAFNNQLEYAAMMIWIGGIFDFLDGFSARLLKVNSEIGKQLDSLADMVTFGVLPSIILYQMILALEPPYFFLPYFAFVITVFSAIRLAKFNIDTRQSDSFIGLPTPANAFCISAFPFIFIRFEILSTSQLLIALLIYVFAFSWLLVVEIEMLALKFKTFGWTGNQTRWLFILTSLTLLATLHITAIPMIIIIYVVTSVVDNSIHTKI